MSARKITNTWWVDFRFRHVRYRRRSPDNTRAGAQAYEAHLRRQLAQEGHAGAKPTIISPTLNEFAKEWFEMYVQVNNKFTEQESKRRKMHKHLLPFFGHLKLDEITEEHIERFKALKQRQELAPKSINNYLAILSKCLNTAIDWGKLKHRPKTKPMRVPPSQFDFLTPEESRALLNHTKVHESFWHGFFLCALRTGMRLGEIFGLRWSDIDFKTNQLTVNQNIIDKRVDSPKNNKARHIPLAADLAQCLTVKTNKKGLVFAKDTGEPLTYDIAYHALKRVTKGAGLRYISWHKLRHTFASQLAAENVSIPIIKELLGHSEIRMTMRYAHMSPSKLHEAIAVLEQAENRDLEIVGNRRSIDKNVALSL